MRISIATKIFIAFSGIVFVFALVLMFGILRTQRLNAQVQALNRSVVPLSLILSDAQNDLKSLDVTLSEPNEEDLSRALRINRVVSNAPEQVSSKIQRALTLSERDSFDKLAEPEQARMTEIRGRLITLAHDSAKLDQHTQELYALLDSSSETDNTKRIEQLRATLQQQTSDLSTGLTRLRNDLRISTDLALIRVGRLERSNLYALGAMSGSALLIALILLGVALLTVRPLQALNSGVKRIADGHYDPIDYRGAKLLGQDELVTLTDEFNSMARALQARDEALKNQHAALLKSERLATVGRMTSLITHELRNPLSSIGLNAEMLQDGLLELPDESRSEYLAHLDTITREVDRLRDITEEYLVYARLPEPKLAHVDLGDLVEQLVDFHVWEWSQSRVNVIFSPPPDPIPIRADANQLRQAMLNLVKNAVEASPPDSTVSIQIIPKDRSFEITITDEGEGIPPELRDSLFEPFVTSKAKGTGLGLAMTQEIITEHGGQLDFECPEDRGTVFTIELPRNHSTEPST